MRLITPFLDSFLIHDSLFTLIRILLLLLLTEARQRLTLFTPCRRLLLL